MSEVDSVAELDRVPNIAPRQKIEQLEGIMRQMPQIEIPPVHYFFEGGYAREITIPKGCTLTGQIHKFSHLNIISKGEISVYTEEGVKRIKAPFAMVSPPGTKRVGYAHEETVWTTIHRTDETEVAKAEEYLIAPSHEAYLEFREGKCLS